MADRPDKSYRDRIRANQIAKNYQVKPGETLTSIAAAAGTSPERLASANRGSTPLDVGQTIRVPSRSGVQEGAGYVAPRPSPVYTSRSARFDTERAQSAPSLGGALLDTLKRSTSIFPRLAEKLAPAFGPQNYQYAVNQKTAEQQYQYGVKQQGAPAAAQPRGQEGGLLYAGLNAKPLLGSRNSLLGSEASLTPTQGMVRIGDSFIPQTAVIQDKNGNSTFLDNVFKPEDIAEYAIFNNISVQQARQVLGNSGYTNVNGTFILQGADVLAQTASVSGGGGYGGKIIPGQDGQYARINSGIIGNNWQVVTRKINGQWVRITESTWGGKGRGGRGGGVGKYGGSGWGGGAPQPQYDANGNPITPITFRASTG